jgi:cell division protein FtsW
MQKSFRKKKSRTTKISNGPAAINKRLFFLTFILVILGLIAIADASAPLAMSRFSDRLYFVKQQFFWAVVGVIMMFVVSKINYKIWEKVATPLFFVGLIGLFLVLIPGFGTKVLGARRWLNLGFTSFQPSEFIKLALLIYIAKVSAKGKKMISYFVPLIIVVGLIMLQPDLGTTLVIVSTTLAQIFISGINIFMLMGTVFSGGVLGIFIILTSGYRRDRLMTFLQQADDPLNKGYHIRQILLALGSGGLTGVGLGASRQKFLFLPETATDSIFAVIAEEVGFIGSSILLAFFIAYFIIGFKIAKNAPDRFSQVLAVGIVSWIVSQTFLNIASMVALVPLTGIPLPFISFGGTSLVAMLIGTGILLNISKYGKN